MTSKQFYDWQTSGGVNDVMRLVESLERADIAWCAIGGVAVNKRLIILLLDKENEELESGKLKKKKSEA